MLLWSSLTEETVELQKGHELLFSQDGWGYVKTPAGEVQWCKDLAPLVLPFVCVCDVFSHVCLCVFSHVCSVMCVVCSVMPSHV